MEKLTEVLGMGGYAAYVWPSFAIATVVMLGMVLVSLRSLKRANRSLANIQEISGRNEA